VANALVYIELEQGVVSLPSLRALNDARKIATRYGATLYAVVPCEAPPGYGENDAVAILSRHGADKVALVTNPQLCCPTVYPLHGPALLEACSNFPPQLVILPATAGGRELGARIALELDGYYVGDVLLRELGDQVTFHRQLFRRKLLSGGSVADAARPLVLCMSSSAAQPHELGVDEAEVVVLQAPSVPQGTFSLVSVEDSPHDRPPLVIGVGAGMSSSGQDLCRQLADKLGAPVVYSHSALTDKEGEVPTGLNGRPIDADTYLTFGISGSERHLAALSPNTRVIAVNKNPDAPIMRIANDVLVDDANAVLKSLLALLDTVDDQAAESPANQPQSTKE
jgi:electron transfer flavoprotein alpha subunit